MKRWRFVLLILLLLSPGVLWGMATCGAHSGSHAAASIAGHGHGEDGKLKLHADCMSSDSKAVAAVAGGEPMQPPKPLLTAALHLNAGHHPLPSMGNSRPPDRYRVSTAPPILLTTLRLRV